MNREEREAVVRRLVQEGFTPEVAREAARDASGYSDARSRAAAIERKPDE